MSEELADDLRWNVWNYYKPVQNIAISSYPKRSSINAYSKWSKYVQILSVHFTNDTSIWTWTNPERKNGSFLESHTEQKGITLKNNYRKFKLETWKWNSLKTNSWKQRIEKTKWGP